MASESLPCIVCLGRIERVIDDYELQPHDAIMCSSTGNYGSTVFDPIGEEKQQLRFNVCDNCLILAGDNGAVAIVYNDNFDAVLPWKCPEVNRKDVRPILP